MSRKINSMARKMRSSLPLLFLFALVTLGSLTLPPFGSNPSFATTTPDYSLPQLSRYADVIVQANVLKNKSFLDGPYVVTETTLKVEFVMKGKVGSEVILRQRGGRVGDYATYVPGMPTYRVGERAILFLEARENDRFVTAAFSQGKLPIIKRHGTDFVDVPAGPEITGVPFNTTAAQSTHKKGGGSSATLIPQKDPRAASVDSHDEGSRPRLILPAKEVRRFIKKWAAETPSTP